MRSGNKLFNPRPPSRTLSSVFLSAYPDENGPWHPIEGGRASQFRPVR